MRDRDLSTLIFTCYRSTTVLCVFPLRVSTSPTKGSSLPVSEVSDDGFVSL